MAIATPAGLDLACLREALTRVLLHHDALRLRYQRVDGRWQQRIDLPVNVRAPLLHVPLAHLDPSARGARIEEALAHLQDQIDLAAGCLLNAGWFDAGPDQPGRLVVIVHHLAVDIVSWPLLVEDITAAYRQLAGGEPVRLSTKTTSFKRWAELLCEYACSDALRQEAAWWLDLCSRTAPPLPRDYPAGENSQESSASLTLDLDEEDTEILLAQTLRNLGTRIHNLVLAAVALALGRWTRQREVRLSVEGHGREDIGPRVNISRTLGWFTSFFPVSLALDPAKDDQLRLLPLVRQLEQIPHRGMGYAVLRYLSPDPAIRQALAAVPDPEVAFNFTGQQGQRPAPDGTHREEAPQPLQAADAWGPISEAVGLVQLSEGTRGARRHLLEISAGVRGGRLRLRWSYSRQVHSADTLRTLAEDTLQILRGYTGHPVTLHTPGDVPAELTDTIPDDPAADAAISAGAEPC
jgi:non-ribosomal peptide synthase protein (TIGR01720 family)